MRFILTLFLGLCLVQSAVAAEPEIKDINISVFTASPVSLIERVAVAKGFLSREGLNAKLVESTSGPAMLAAVIGGSSHFAVGAIPITWGLHGQGVCIAHMAAGQGGMYKLIERAEGGTPARSKPYPENVREMKGKRIGVVARGGAVEQWVKMVASEAGLDPDKEITFVATGGMPTAVAALQNKQVDMIVGWPPIEWAMPANSVRVVANLFNGDVPTLKGMLQAASTTTCDFRRANPETYKRYCRAIHRSYGFVTDPKNAAEVAAILGATLAVSPQVANEIWAEYKSSYAGPRLSRENWEAQAKFMVKKDGRPPVPPPYEQVVDGSCGQS